MERFTIFETLPTNLDRRKVISLLIVPSYLVVTAVLFLMDGTATFADPMVLLLLNSVFLGLIPLYVAYISVISFRKSGPTSLLLLGSGMLFFGLGSIAAGLVGLMPNSANLNDTFFNVGACAGATLQFTGALAALAGWTVHTSERRQSLAATAYAGVFLVLAGIIIATFLGLTPVFFIPGTGSTLVRWFVLAGAIEFFLLASVLFFALYWRRREDFFFWYAIGMTIIGLATFDAIFVMANGDVFSWAVQTGQYLGASFVLVAFLALQRRASSRNVSDQEMLAAFFVEAEAGYRQLVETAGDAIVVLDPGDRILLWNAAAEKMFGYTPDEAVGASFPNLVLGGAEVPLPGDEGASAPPAPIHQEMESRRRDGSPIPIELTVARRTIDGQAIATCIIHDLSERKQAEAALLESEDKYRTIVETAGEGIVIARPAGGSIYVNQRMADLLGYPLDEILGKSSLDFMFEDCRPQVLESHNELRMGKATKGEFKFRRRDGSAAWVLFNATPIFDEKGDHVSNLTMYTDITERKKGEDALRRYSADLERSNEELKRYAYVASHDLQEPLRGIVSFSQLLDRRYRGRLDKDADEYIQFIVEEGLRMQALIRDLLRFSRIEIQAQPLTPTDAGLAVRSVLRSLEPQIHAVGGSAVVDPLPMVMADLPQLEQIFTHLIGNAIKYRRPEVPVVIQISAERHGARWEFAVRDNGIGIEPQYFDRIFEMFRRLHTRHDYEGTGIGLTIVRKIVERHGGRTRVESTFGEGSTFFFTLPAV